MKHVFWLCLFIMSAQLLSAQSPIAAKDTATVIQYGKDTVKALANDSNLHAGDTLFIKSVFGAPTGWTTLLGNKYILFHALDSTFLGMDTFYYQVCDKHDTTLCDTGTVVITIRRLLPLAIDDTASLWQFDVDTISPLANDTNYHTGDSLCLRSVWGGTPGWAVLQGCKHIIFHATDSTFTGPDTLYYRVCDIVTPTLCDTGMIVVNVRRLFPIAVTDSASLSQPGSITLHVLANDTNFHYGDTLHITDVWDTIPGWVHVQANGTVTYHPLDPNFEGLDTFYYSSCDIHATNLCDTGMVIIYVFPLPTVAHFTHTDSACGITLIDHSTHADLLTWQINGIYSGLNLTFNYEDTIMIDWTTGFIPDVYVICLTSSNPTNSSTICDTISTGCIGIREIPAADLSIYPNPASDMIRVDISRAGQSALTDLTAIELYDVVGQKLKTSSVSAITTISISDLSNGIYLIVSLDNNGARRVMGKCEVLR